MGRDLIYHTTSSLDEPYAVDANHSAAAAEHTFLSAWAAQQFRGAAADELAEAGRDGISWPGHPGITEIQRHIADAVNMALTGTLTPQEALDQAAEEVNEILSDY